MDAAGGSVGAGFVNAELCGVNNADIGLVAFFEVAALFDAVAVGGCARHFADYLLWGDIPAPAEQEELREGLEGRNVLPSLLLDPCVGHEYRHIVLHERTHDRVVVIFIEIDPARAIGVLNELQIHIQRLHALLFGELNDRFALVFGVFIVDICDSHIFPVDAEHLAVHKNGEAELETVQRRIRLLLGELCIPFGEHDGDDRCAVMKCVIIICNGLALSFEGVENIQHLVELFPRFLAREDKVAVLRANARLLHDINYLVKGDLEVGFLGDERIFRADRRAGSRMDGENSVVFRDLPREGIKLLLGRVSIRLIHEAHRAAECAVLHRLMNVVDLIFELLRGERRRVVAADARTDRAVTDERHDIDMEPARELLAERSEAAGEFRLKEAAAELVSVGRIFIRSERRKAAIAGYLGGDALPDERAEEFLAVRSVAEEVVMRMSINKAGANIKTGCVDRLIRRFVALADLENFVVLNKDVADKRSIAAAVEYSAVFE